MLIKESFSYIRSLSQTHFTGIITNGASEYEDIAVGGGVLPGYITSLKILSIQNLNWRVEFYSRSLDPFVAATRYVASAYPYENNALLGTVAFTKEAATGYATSYLYYTQSLKIPYIDEDGVGELHVSLKNENATSKLEGDAGAVHLMVGFISAA